MSVARFAAVAKAVARPAVLVVLVAISVEDALMVAKGASAYAAATVLNSLTTTLVVPDTVEQGPSAATSTDEEFVPDPGLPPDATIYSWSGSLQVAALWVMLNEPSKPEVAVPSSLAAPPYPAVVASYRLTAAPETG